MDKNETCICGESDCWDADDYSWLSSQSGWYGDINGFLSSVFFIHGKRIREQRDLPECNLPIEEFVALIRRGAEGLPNARFVYYKDTGGGEPGWWIEGEREPNEDDLARLQEVRKRTESEERRSFERLSKKYG